MLTIAGLLATTWLAVAPVATAGLDCMPVYREYEIASPAPGVGDVKIVQRSSCSPFEVYYDGQPVIGP